jgi:hypothetical protein
MQIILSGRISLYYLHYDENDSRRVIKFLAKVQKFVFEGDVCGQIDLVPLVNYFVFHGKNAVD